MTAKINSPAGHSFFFTLITKFSVGVQHFNATEIQEDVSIEFDGDDESGRMKEFRCSAQAQNSSDPPFSSSLACS
jgi:hypothetical protein